MFFLRTVSKVGLIVALVALVFFSIFLGVELSHISARGTWVFVFEMFVYFLSSLIIVFLSFWGSKIKKNRHHFLALIGGVLVFIFAGWFDQNVGWAVIHYPLEW